MRAAKPLVVCASSACCACLLALIAVAGAGLAIIALPWLVQAVWAGLPF